MTPKKTPLPVQEVPAEPPKPKIIERWGATEETWMLGHEDELIVLHMRSGVEISGYLIGTDRYTVTVETPEKKKRLIYKHAIDFHSD